MIDRAVVLSFLGFFAVVAGGSAVLGVVLLVTGRPGPAAMAALDFGYSAWMVRVVRRSL